MPPTVREEVQEPLRRCLGWLASLRDGRGRILCPEHRVEHTGKSAYAIVSACELLALDPVRDGDFLCARSSDPDDGIGPYLLRQGAISRRELEAALGEAAGRAAAGDLVTHVDPEQLERHLCDQMAELIRLLFSWGEGSYRFRPGLTADAISVDLERRSVALVLEGVRSVRRWSRIERGIGARDAVYRLSQTADPACWQALPEEHRVLLDRFAGGLSIEEGAGRAGVPEQFLHQLVWGAKVLGLVEAQETPPALRALIAALSGAVPEAEGIQESEDGIDWGEAEGPPAGSAEPGAGGVSDAGSDTASTSARTPASESAGAAAAFDLEAMMAHVAARVTAGSQYESFYEGSEPAAGHGTEAAAPALDLGEDLAPDLEPDLEPVGAPSQAAPPVQAPPVRALKPAH